MSTQNEGNTSAEAQPSPPRPGLEPGTLVGDRYEIVRLIGEGGMGSVYEARHKILGRHVAIKVLKPEVVHNESLVARFLQEAKAAAELHHKNIVELTDYGVDGDRPYMVMELLKGEDLGHLLKREGQLSVPRLVTILDPVLRALAMAHERGVIHRDIKPENIFLVHEDEGEPTPKIVDFGIAKRQEENVQLTSANMALGTPAYMAPEQIMSSRTVTGAADQYAVGVTMYEALTGRNPYDAETLNAFIVAKATQDPEPLDRVRPDLDPRFVAIVHRTLARKPEERFPTIAALREALSSFRTASLRPPPANANAATIARPMQTPAVATPAVPAQPTQQGYAVGSPQATTPASMVVPVPVVVQPASRSMVPAVLGGIAVTVALGIAGYVGLGARSTAQQPTDHPPTTQTPPPQAGQNEVQFSIEVEPREAEIKLDGEVIGRGRAEVVRPKDGRRHQLQVEAPGYETVSEVLAADNDVRINRQLARLTATPTPPNTPTNNPTPAGRTPRGAHAATVDVPVAQPRVEPPPTQPRVDPPPAQPRVDPPPAQPRVDPPSRTYDPSHPNIDPTDPFANH